MATVAEPPKSTVRDAEKSRKPTCRFADRVGRCAVDAFEHLRTTVGLEYRQTVVAAVIVMRCVNGASELWVASVGAGTKFLRQAQVDADRAGGCVRDCHAEVLARRCFRRYIAAEIRRHQLRTRGGDDAAVADAPPPLFKAARHEDGRLQVAEGVTFHLYSSSQPCGNASIKRWAKATAGPSNVECGDCEWPGAAHPRLQVPKHARLEGMIAASVKREPKAVSDFPTGGETALAAEGELHVADSGAAGAADVTPSDGTKQDGVTSSSELPPGRRPKAASEAEPEFATGTAAVGSGRGCVLSCSDKICRHGT